MCANSYFERTFSYAAPFLWNRLDMSIRMLDFNHLKSRIQTELDLRYVLFLVYEYEYDLYSIVPLIVSANQLAMCTCILIAVLIYHDVIILTLPSIEYIARYSYRSEKNPHLELIILYFMLPVRHSVNYV